MNSDPTFDLSQVARARRKYAHGGMDYLLTRVRDELVARWTAVHGDDDGDGARRVLVVDDECAEWSLGDGVTVEIVSPLDLPAGSLFDGDGDGADGFGGLFQTPAELPAIRGGNFDDIIIVLQLAWFSKETVLNSAALRLRAGGRLWFCTFGPDTVIQLRNAWAAADDHPHVHPFTDMHDLGDAMLSGGFVDPIVDVDRVTVEYARADLLFADLRGEGFTNALTARRKTLTGKTRFMKFTDALTAQHKKSEPLTVTFELIYGVATAPEKSPFKVTVTRN